MRVFHPWNEREEFQEGMWAKASGAKFAELSEAARKLMASPADFKAAMQRAVAHWPKSTEHNLSAVDTNRRAWMGHAGCFIATKSVEESTRIGWHKLTASQQFEADRVAQEVIDEWDRQFLNRTQLELWPDLAASIRGRTSTDA